MLQDKSCIIRCIQSCRTPKQLSNTYGMIEWFYERWKDRADMFALSLAMNDLFEVYQFQESQMFII